MKKCIIIINFIMISCLVTIGFASSGSAETILAVTDDSVVESFTKAFDRIKQDGVYDKIIYKHIE